MSHERFLREARSAATLNHPNVCAIYDTGEQDGRPYLVMELLRGETLKRYLANAGETVCPPTRWSRLAKQAAAALAAAHAKGIIHRDIKPANLFVVEAGSRQASDQDSRLWAGQEAGWRGGRRLSHLWRCQERRLGPQTRTGQAATIDLTSPGSAVGTVAYMSPEQAKGVPLDARTDLFSLGSVIYEMATGKTPFGGNSTAEVFAALLTRESAAGEHGQSSYAEEAGCHRAKLLAQGSGASAMRAPRQLRKIWRGLMLPPPARRRRHR